MSGDKNSQNNDLESLRKRIDELDKRIEVLKRAYEERLKKKFASDQEKLRAIMTTAEGESPLGILRRLRELDDTRK